MSEINEFNLNIRSKADSDASKLATAQWKVTLARHPEIEFVWLQFILFEGTMRTRMIPVASFTKLIEDNQYVSISSAYLHALRNDGISEAAASTGAVYLAPDLSTASINSRESSRIRILASFLDENHSPRIDCPRSKLANLSDILSHLHGFYVLVGYEIEVVFFKTEDTNGEEPLRDHKCSAVTYGMRSLLPMLENIVRTLQEEKIHLEQFHSELAPGQWEFVLPPKRPLEAVDTLVRAREIISTISKDYGYQATLHPRPFADNGGSGAHLHLSVNAVNSSAPPKKEHTDPFFAGVINHFPSLMAFCLPLDASYERVATGIWSGGEYVSWGWQNKETALRRIANNRFEVKLHCGMANPYCSLASILAAGLDGLNRSLPLVAGDCQVSPAELSDGEREQLGIRPLPRDLKQSIEHLDADSGLKQILGEMYTATYIAITKDWNQQLSELDVNQRRATLLQYY